MQAKFIFLTNDEQNGKVKLYFSQEDTGDVIEISWGNADYIKNKLEQFKAKSVDDLSKILSDPKHAEQEVYKYSYKDKEGNQREGFTLDEPFPTASEPDKAIVTGKVTQVRDNGLKIAVIVDTGKGSTFTVVRSYYVWDANAKKSYPLEYKRQNLLNMFGVKEFGDLTGSTITFVRQSAGKNYYYEPAAE